MLYKCECYIKVCDKAKGLSLSLVNSSLALVCTVPWYFSRIDYCLGIMKFVTKQGAANQREARLSQKRERDWAHRQQQGASKTSPKEQGAEETAKQREARLSQRRERNRELVASNRGLLKLPNEKGAIIIIVTNLVGVVAQESGSPHDAMHLSSNCDITDLQHMQSSALVTHLWNCCSTGIKLQAFYIIITSLEL